MNQYINKKFVFSIPNSKYELYYKLKNHLKLKILLLIQINA